MNKYLLKRLNTPLMIEYGYLEALLSQEMRITGAKSKGSFAGSIQVIPVYGALSHRSTGLLSWLFGDVMTYESIRRDFQAALTNSEVGSILFDIDSHGGEVAGVFDLADDIYKARGSKPILAIANENALSAAYLIASAADEIYLSRTADVGSIGVTAVHCDYSQMEAKAGLKYTAIYAGDRKNDFTPHEPLSKEAYTEAKKAVDGIYDMFVSTVARNRSISEQTVRDTQALIYKGQDAVNMGLADGVMSFNQTVNNILGEVSNMSLKAELKALLEGKQDADVVEAMAACGFVIKASDERVTEILNLCAIANVRDMGFAKSLITEGVSVKEAQERILKAKADDSNKTEIFSTVSAISTGEVDLLISDAKRRAGREV